MLTLAHVKWFVDGDTPDIESISQSEILSVLGLIALGIGLLVVAHRYIEPRLIPKQLIRKLVKYSKYIPDIVRISTGLLLIINFFLGYLYAPNVTNNGSSLHQSISLLLLVLGTLLLVGSYVRLAGLGLLSIYLLSLIVVEPWNNVFDHIEYLGLGAYLFMANPGKYELLNLRALGRAPKELAAKAADTLRVLIGLNLIVLAISEKLANLSDATYFLGEHQWNLLSFTGLSDRWFIITAGVIEIIVGLSFVLNLATRLTTLMLVGLMTTTALLLGVEEVYGHLFAVSLVAVVWLQAKSRKT